MQDCGCYFGKILQNYQNVQLTCESYLMTLLCFEKLTKSRHLFVEGPLCRDLSYFLIFRDSTIFGDIGGFSFARHLTSLHYIKNSDAV